MDTNTVTNNTVVTQVTTVAKTAPKLGRKATAVTEITNKDFTIETLVAANPNVKPPTIRAFVARNVASGRYTVVGSHKSGGRGKPANIYRIKA